MAAPSGPGTTETGTHGAGAAPRALTGRPGRPPRGAGNCATSHDAPADADGPTPAPRHRERPPHPRTERARHHGNGDSWSGCC
ncbi:hypothetical protein C3492_11125, partial [Streptomyces sp. Ru62]